MGTRTFGDTSNGDSAHYVFFDTANGVSFVSGDSISITEDAWIDALYFYVASETTNAPNSIAALYTTGLGSKFFQTPAFTLGTTVSWQRAGLAAGSYYHLPAGNAARGAVLSAGGGGMRTWGRDDTGSYLYNTPASSLPVPIGGTVKSGFGNMPWYISYFPTATVTGYKSGGVSTTVSHVGDQLEIDGLSFSSGIVSIDFNGVAADLGGLNQFSDTGLNINVPSGATTGPVHVVTNAGTATGPTLTVSGGRVEHGGVLIPSSLIRVQNGGALKQVVRVRAYRSGSLVDVH